MKRGENMKIITISREFASGGRELGKRLSDLLGYDYYDKEIISEIAEKNSKDEKYIEWALSNREWQNIPLTYGRSFSNIPLQSYKIDILLEQRKVIEEIGKAGRDCIIVGRNADVILQDFQPFNIFVCSDMKSKIRRSAERGPEGENLTEKELKRKICKVDKDRAKTRSIITGIPWGERSTYELTVNTASWQIKELTKAVAQFAESWFKRSR